MNKVAVLGGGSFGTVIANMVAKNGCTVSLWLRDQVQSEQINNTHENNRYLPGYSLSKKITASTNMQQVLKGAELVFISIDYFTFWLYTRVAVLKERRFLLTIFTIHV